MEDLAGARNTKLLFGEKYPEKLRLLQLLISSTTWMIHNQNVRVDVLQHAGIHQRKVIWRPQGEMGRKTSEFTWNICHNLKGWCSPGRAGDCTGSREHPDTGEVLPRAARSPDWGLEILNLWGEIGVRFKSQCLALTVTLAAAQTAAELIQGHWIQALPRVVGTEWDREIQRVMLELLMPFPWSKKFKEFTCRNKTLEEDFSA